MTTKRSSDESGDEVGPKAKKQHATNTLSPAGEVSEEDEQRGWEAEVEEEKKRTRSGNPKPKPKPIHHNNGASGTPSMEGKRRKKKQLDEIYDLLQATVAKVANIVLALASDGGSELDKAGAEVAHTLARSGLAALIGTACDRFKFVLKELFDLTRERIHKRDSQYQNIEHMDVYTGFLAALCGSYNKLVEKLFKKCKKTVQHRLDSAIST